MIVGSAAAAAGWTAPVAKLHTNASVDSAANSVSGNDMIFPLPKLLGGQHRDRGGLP
jgi:hypothetical protein